MMPLPHRPWLKNYCQSKWIWWSDAARTSAKRPIEQVIALGICSLPRLWNFCLVRHSLTSSPAIVHSPAACQKFRCDGKRVWNRDRAYCPQPTNAATYRRVDTPYSARPEGSSSKLNTYRDGWRILKVIIDLIISERPLLIFGTLFLFSGLLSFILFTPIVWNYITTGLVPRFPTLFVAGFIGLFSILCLFFGYLYDRIAQTRREIKRMFYLIQTPLTNEKNINI